MCRDAVEEMEVIEEERMLLLNGSDMVLVVVGLSIG